MSEVVVTVAPFVRLKKSEAVQVLRLSKFGGSFKVTNRDFKTELTSMLNRSNPTETKYCLL